MKLRFFILILAVLAVIPVNAQEIITAERYLKMVSERYGSIRDYEAHIVIHSGSSEMAGNVSYLSPSFLRIDFTKPADQVIVFNGELLTVYLPEYRAILNQTITPGRRPASGASLASAQGLALLERNYVASFVTGPDPVALQGSPQEEVVRLRLARRNISEGFREIILSINPATKTIRRIEGRTIADSLVQFDFTNIKTNQGIPEMRFIYDSPASANVYNNFLFREVD
ncbi:MAG: outer-membrane lipoprotein carrier protein LolA [Treponema sp.]|jgi:outer membrane lipoprotein-sorting protein|nr:outer-membrane lipoprotein carrier protein LolA [Treponema sp.]